MGKYKDKARAAAKVVNAGFIIAKWERLIRGGVVKPPIFWDAIQAVPPSAPPFWAPPPQELKFPEDDLVKIYMKRNPDWKNEVFKGHRTARVKNEKSRAHLFVSQWQRYIEQGMKQEEAYAKVDQEFRSLETYKDKQLEEEVELLIKGKHPAINAWHEEEQFYVQQAYDHHRKEWEAKNRAAQLEAKLKEQTEIEAAEKKIRDAEEAKNLKEALKNSKKSKNEAPEEEAAEGGKKGGKDKKAQQQKKGGGKTA